MITVRGLEDELRESSWVRLLQEVRYAQVAQTQVDPRTEVFTIILRVNTALEERITACRPYTYPEELVANTEIVLEGLKGWIEGGRIGIFDNELFALGLTEGPRAREIGVTFMGTDRTYRVPHDSDPISEWQEWLIGTPTRVHKGQLHTQFLDIAFVPQRVPLLGPTEQLDPFVRVSRGWNLLGTGTETVTKAREILKPALKDAGHYISV